nr:hypothetical protein [Candidatus Dadabacteria bacterium]
EYDLVYDEILIKELSRPKNKTVIDNENYLNEYEDIKPFYDPYPELTQEMKNRLKRRSKKQNKEIKK